MGTSALRVRLRSTRYVISLTPQTTTVWDARFHTRRTGPDALRQHNFSVWDIAILRG